MQLVLDFFWEEIVPTVSDLDTLDNITSVFLRLDFFPASWKDQTVTKKSCAEKKRITKKIPIGIKTSYQNKKTRETLDLTLIFECPWVSLFQLLNWKHPATKVNQRQIYQKVLDIYLWASLKDMTSQWFIKLPSFSTQNPAWKLGHGSWGMKVAGTE